MLPLTLTPLAPLTAMRTVPHQAFTGSQAATSRGRAPSMLQLTSLRFNQNYT